MSHSMFEVRRFAGSRNGPSSPFTRKPPPTALPKTCTRVPLSSVVLRTARSRPACQISSAWLEIERVKHQYFHNDIDARRNQEPAVGLPKRDRVHADRRAFTERAKAHVCRSSGCASLERQRDKRLEHGGPKQPECSRRSALGAIGSTCFICVFPSKARASSLRWSYVTTGSHPPA